MAGKGPGPKGGRGGGAQVLCRTPSSLNGSEGTVGRRRLVRPPPRGQSAGGGAGAAGLGAAASSAATQAPLVNGATLGGIGKKWYPTGEAPTPHRTQLGGLQEVCCGGSSQVLRGGSGGSRGTVAVPAGRVTWVGECTVDARPTPAPAPPFPTPPLSPLAPPPARAVPVCRDGTIETLLPLSAAHLPPWRRRRRSSSPAPRNPSPRPSAPTRAGL